MTRAQRHTNIQFSFTSFNLANFIRKCENRFRRNVSVLSTACFLDGLLTRSSWHTAAPPVKKIECRPHTSHNSDTVFTTIQSGWKQSRLISFVFYWITKFGATLNPTEKNTKWVAVSHWTQIYLNRTAKCYYLHTNILTIHQIYNITCFDNQILSCSSHCQTIVMSE